MDAVTVRQLLQDHLSDCEFHVQGEGNHYDITAIGAVFEGCARCESSSWCTGPWAMHRRWQRPCREYSRLPRRVAGAIRD